MNKNSNSRLDDVSIPNTAIICLSPYYGGMEMDAFQLAKMLSEYTNVTFIVKKNSLIENKHRDEAYKLNINIESISFINNISLTLILGVRKIIKMNDIKNVIYFGASELKSLYFSFIGLNTNLLIKHGTTKSSSKKDFLHRLIYSTVNFHIAICEHIASNVKKIIPFGKNTQLVTIYSSLRNMPSNIRPSELCISRPIVLLHVARITDGKGQIDAIKACEVLYEQKKNFTFYLVGDMDPAYEKKFLLFLNDIPYKDSIKLEGFTTDIAEYYRKSDIFIFPSKGEGLSNSFIEALSYGLSCISYRNTSFPELKMLGFEFSLAVDQDIDSLKNSLQNTSKYIENNPIPIIENIELSRKLFTKERELKDFIKLLL